MITRKFIPLTEYAILHSIGYSSVYYRVKNRHVPRAYLKHIKSRFRRQAIRAIRADYQMNLTKKRLPTYSDREWEHTVFLPGGIKKVLEPHEYKNKNWRRFSTVA